VGDIEVWAFVALLARCLPGTHRRSKASRVLLANEYVLTLAVPKLSGADGDSPITVARPTLASTPGRPRPVREHLAMVMPKGG
jgi:hypothetical protein